MLVQVLTTLIFFVNNKLKTVCKSTLMHKTRCLRIFHQNVCGISNKTTELELYIATTGFQLDYLCITEHFLNQQSANVFNFPNYNLVSYNTRTNKKRGGSLILALSNTESENIDFVKKMYKSDSFEICGVKDLETGLYLFCCYRSPYDKNFESFMSSLEKLLEHFINKKCLICGDFNIDVLVDSKKHTEFLSILTCYNFRYLLNTPTFIRNNANSCLDNIITNLADNEIDDYTVDHNGLADGHGGLFCNLALEKIKSKSKNSNQNVIIKKRIFNNKNNIAFKNSINNINWVNMGINSFISCLTKTFQDCYRKKSIRIQPFKNTSLQWITKGVKVSSRMKRVLCSGTVNNASLKKYKTNYVRIYRRVIQQLKKNAIVNNLNTATNITKQTWKLVNECTKKTKNRQCRNLILKVNNKMITDPQQVANHFIDSFVFKSSLASEEKERAMSFLIESTKRVESDLTFCSTTPSEIAKVISKMANKKSCGFDDLPISILKENIDSLAAPLSDFLNKCFEECVFPDQLKLAKVVPIFKKGIKSNPKSYRPISLLPTISKVFEKIIKTRLMVHLNANKIINLRQFGYQKGVGCSDAINALINDIINKLNDKMKVAGLFIDLSSAFDTIDYELLLTKLEYYGIRGKSLQLLRSYLHNRQMFVEIKNIDDSNHEVIYTSKITNIKRGVPQGSILGPILFIIVTNDLLNFMHYVQPDVKLVVFADDTNIIVGANDLKELTKNVNKSLQNLCEWLTANNLLLNTSKTNIILFKTTTRHNDSLDVKIKDNKIELVDKVKFLGITIDMYLNWKQELAAIDASISSACYALRSLRDMLVIKQLKAIYYALVESRLRYSIMLWGNSYSYNCEKAFILQKRAIRTMVRISQRDSCREHFKKLNFLTVPSLYILVVLNHLALNIHEFESQEERKIRESTRRKDFKHKMAPKFNIAKYSCRYQAVELFNRLPTDLKLLIYSSHSFKTKLKAFLLEKCFYSVSEFINDKSSHLK